MALETEHFRSVLLVCRNDAARTHMGTAWVHAPGRAMTAWHVVASLGDFLLASSDGNAVTAKCIGHSVEGDVALLAFDATKLDAPPLPMNDDGDWRQGDRWSSYGHPIGFPSGFPIDGTVSSPATRIARQRRMSLNCIQGPKEKIHGMSGSPIIDQHGAVAGVLIGYPADLAQVTLFAVRLDDAFNYLSEAGFSVPQVASHGGISQYVGQQLREWNRPTHTAPFLRRAAPQLSAIFIAPRFRTPRSVRQQGRTGDLHTAETLLERLSKDDRHLIIRGDPGTGKSVLLRWLAVRAGQDWGERQRRAFVPLIVHAAHLAALDLPSVMDHALTGKNFALPPGSSWLLMVDGLDEVVDINERTRVIDNLRRRSAGVLAFRGSPVRVILASRPLAILDEFTPAEVQQVVMQPFSKSQLKAFAEAWFGSEATQRSAAEFIIEVELADLEGLTSIPALATMAAVVFECSPTKTLPRRRSELYDLFISLMLKERATEAWDAFVALSRTVERGMAGDALASRLWQQCSRLAEELAMRIQEGRIALATEDLIEHAVLIAREGGLLAQHGPDRLLADQQWDLMQHLLLNSGLFIIGANGRLEFFHNTLREALVARALTGQIQPTGEQMWPIVRRWSEARWREIVLIALSNWSEQGEAASRAIWTLLEPVMNSSKRGLQFVGLAVAEGVQLPAENEAKVTATLFKGMGAWLPCADLFSEFKSPNPLDVLRLLTRRERFVDLLVEEFKDEPEQCEIKMWAFLELTLDQGGAARIRQFLSHGGKVTLATAVLLARSGEGEETAGLLISALSSLECKKCRRIAEVVAEYCPAESLRQLLEAPDIPIDGRFSAAAAGWRRYKDDELLITATKLFSFLQLASDDEEDMAMTRRALALPDFGATKPHIDATRMVLLAALCTPAGADRIGIPAWVRATCDDERETPPMRAYACAAVMYAEPENCEAAACATRLSTHPDVPQSVRETLFGAFAFSGNARHLLDVAGCADHPLPTRVAAASAATPLLESAAATLAIESLFAQMKSDRAHWNECAAVLARAGHIAMAADKYEELVLSDQFNGGANEIRKLMDLGCAAHIARIVHAKRKCPLNLQFAVRCLGQMGDTHALMAVVADIAIPSAVRVHAVNALSELGWVDEAAIEACRIGESIADWRPENPITELQSYTLAWEVAHGDWPVSILADMAKEAQSHRYLWQDRMIGVLDVPTLTPGDVQAIMKALGPGAVPVERILDRCHEIPDEGRTFLRVADIALDFGDVAGAVSATAMALQHAEGNCFTSVRILHSCAERIAKLALTRERNQTERYSDAECMANKHYVHWDMVEDWLDVVHRHHSPMSERIRLLLRALESNTGQEQIIEFLTIMASEESEESDDASAVWKRAATVSTALEEAEKKREACKVAQAPLTKGFTVELENENCVTALLVLARCGDISTVRNEVLQIALGNGTSAQRVTAAAAVTYEGSKEVIHVLQEICFQTIENSDIWQTQECADAIEALLYAGALNMAADAALALAKKYTGKRSPRIFQELWGRAVLKQTTHTQHNSG